jgi:outer membrane translocation and assembly module TamA
VSKRLWPTAIVLLSLSGFLSAQESPAPLAAFHIRNVRFENTTRLSVAQKSQLTDDLRQLANRSVDGGVSALSGSVEHAALAAYADQGYWHAKVKIEIDRADDVADREVSVTVRAVDEGRSYRLRNLQWTGVSAFAEADLTELVPVHPGRILQRSKVAEGMDAVRRLYLGGGYLSYVAVPDVEMNDRDGTAEVRIHVDEGGLFTVQGFDVIGLNPALRARLLQAWPFKPGDVYRGDNVENFLYSNASLLPPVVPNDVVCRTVDLSNHTVEFVLDFRPQPVACNSQAETQVTRQSLNRMGSNR